MRLFAAVLPPAGITAELAVQVARLRELPGEDRLRWTGRPGWHLTLAFYGEVDDGLLPALSDRLARAAHRTAPFRLALAGGGQFGHGKALWTGAAGDVEALRVLAGRAEAAARKAGLARDEHRRYKAHLTLARARDTLDTRPYLDALAGFRGAQWTVSELALVRSRLPRSGVPGEQPRYETVGRWPFEAAG